MSHPSLDKYQTPEDPNPELQVSLRKDQWELVIGALSAVTPTGGGSKPFLINNLVMAQTGLGPNDDIMFRLFKNALIEAKDAGVIKGFDMGAQDPN